MRKPDTTNRPSHHRSEHSLRGTVGHVALLLSCGVVAWLAIPHPAAPSPWLWAGWAASLAIGAVLLGANRRQPGIDDRQVDLILAVTTLAGALWTLYQWPSDQYPVAATMAWLLTLAACLLLLSGARAFGWVWPAAIPALTGLLPPMTIPMAIAVVWAGCLVIGAILVARLGVAPHDQLTRVPPHRLAQALAALGVVAVVARLGVMA